MISKKHQTRRPVMESLENRRLMAGDVAVALEGSYLRIEGDNLANQIAITRTAVGDVVIAGQTGTLINGLPSLRLVRPSINAVEISMGSGNDSVAINSLLVANDLNVDLGAGNDRLTMPATAPSTIGAKLSVQGAEGNDVILLSGTRVREDLTVDGGVGQLNAQLNGVVVDKVLAVVADRANDFVAINNSRIGLDVAIETKEGSDQVTVQNTSALSMLINTDANGAVGLDQVNLNRVQVREDLLVSTGDGADTVRMTDVTSAKNITVSLDAGNDQLVATRVAAAADAVFEGGAGFDTLFNYGISGGIKREFKEFERVVV